jgi:hypothetical protein
MKKSHLLTTVSACLFAATANAAVLPLESRLGGLAYYDPNLHITWLEDANYAYTSGYVNGITTTYNDGRMTWDQANAWAISLNINGITGWRLPSADVNGDLTFVNCGGGGVTGCADNEMGFLYWEEGVTGAAPSPFINLQDSVQTGFTSYWYGTPSNPPFNTNAWGFNFSASGGMSTLSKSTNLFAMAVYNGDVGAVPIPAAVWLFGSGLLGLIGLSRRKKAA